MSFDFRRKYDVLLVVGNRAPWTNEVWKHVAECLDSVFGRPTKTAVRSGRRLGYLVWKDAAKWTGGNRRKFEYAQVWAPSWTECDRRDRPPDVFFKILNPAWRAMKGMTSLTLFACALDCEAHQLAPTSAKKLTSALGAVETYKARRPWGRTEGSFFIDAFQDLLSSVVDPRFGSTTFQEVRQYDLNTRAQHLLQWVRSA